jgi:DNA polymerase III subunit delta'
MRSLLLHPSTEKHLNAAMQQAPHAIIISGARGAGKKTAALFVTKYILQVNKLSNYPYFLEVLPIKDSIGIDAIRQVKSFLDKKTTGGGKIRRVVLIGDAHTMTTEAQNALLKALEEPPADTMLILTTNDIAALKPTILSRSQHISILPVDKISAIKQFKDRGHTENSITSAYYMSGGQVGLLVALLEHSIDHEIANAIQMAKDFLHMDVYKRLAQVDTLSKHKEEVLLFIEGMQRVIVSGLEQAALKNNYSQVKKFHLISALLQEAQGALQKNANAKLVLSNLFLQM